MKTIHRLVCVLLLVLLTACSAAPAQTPSSTPTAEPPQRTVPDKIPQPASGKGSVVGVLETENKQNLIGLIVYLGEAIKVDENLTGGFLDTSKAPSTMPDGATGKFYFADVAPGLYTLIFYEVGIGGRAYQDASGNVMTIEVKADQIKDIGAIPLPQ